MDTQKDSRRARVNTRARLIEAATQVFVDKGFSGARIDDVVAAAGFTRGAFYSNYSSMQELLGDVLCEHSRAVVDEFTRAFDSIDGVLDVDAVMGVLDTLRPRARSTYILLVEYRLYMMRNPDMRILNDNTRHDIFTVIEKLIQSVLERMKRTPLVPLAVFAETLSLFYLESLANEESLAPESQTFSMRTIVEGVIYALSGAADGTGDAESPIAQRLRPLL